MLASACDRRPVSSGTVSRLPEALETHFHDPRGAGPLPGATGEGRASNPACGDLLEVRVEVRGERVAAARFLARSCSAVIASASVACEALEGMEVAEARRLDVAGLVGGLGVLPATRAHGPRVVQRALDEALADHASRCHSRSVPASPPAPDEPCSDS